MGPFSVTWSFLLMEVGFYIVGMILSIILLFTSCCSLSGSCVRTLLLTTGILGLCGNVLVPIDVGRALVGWSNSMKLYSQFTFESFLWWISLGVYIFCIIASCSVNRGGSYHRQRVHVAYY